MTCQEAASGSHLLAKERGFRATNPVGTLIWTSGLQHCENICVGHLSHLDCGSLLWQPELIKTVRNVHSMVPGRHQVQYMFTKNPTNGATLMLRHSQNKRQRGEWKDKRSARAEF